MLEGAFLLQSSLMIVLFSVLIAGLITGGGRGRRAASRLFKL